MADRQVGLGPLCSVFTVSVGRVLVAPSSSLCFVLRLSKSHECV